MNEDETESQSDQQEFDLTAQHKLIAEVYRYMMVGSAMMVCLSHGANDVANAISPLLVVTWANMMNDNVAYLVGSLGISLGLLLLGRRVMETVGKDVVKLDFPKGFSAQYATATSVILGTLFGFPLSTTHCMVGSLFGLILASKTELVARVYDPQNFKSGVNAEENKAVNKKLIGKIVLWWLATVPVAMVTAMVCTWLTIKLT